MKLILSTAIIIWANIICEAGVVKENLEEEESKVHIDTTKLQDALQEFMKPQHFPTLENEKPQETNIYRDTPIFQLDLLELMKPEEPNKVADDEEEASLTNEDEEQENISDIEDGNDNGFLILPPGVINHLLNAMDSKGENAEEADNISESQVNNEIEGVNDSDVGQEEQNDGEETNEPRNERCLLGTKGCNIHCLTKGHRYGRCIHGKCHCY